MHDAPLEAHAGESVLFGRADGPELQWQFGDGSPEVTASLVEHTFSRSGQYRVQGLRRGRAFEQVVVGVSPRAVLRAVPADAELVLFVPRTQGALEPAVDFLERALQGLASGLAEKQAFARYALELSGGPPPEETGLDPEEGLAAFVLPDPAVVVAAVGIADEARALQFARRQFGGEDMRVVRHDADGLLLEDATRGDRLLAFGDRGYLYLARFDAELVAADGPARLTRAIRGAETAGLEADGRLQRLRAKVGSDAQAFLFLPRLSRAREASALAGFRFTADALEIDGLVDAKAPLWPGEDAAQKAQRLPLLDKGPENPVLAATFSVPPRTLSELLLGAGLQRGGTKEEGEGAITALAEVLTGEAWISGWVDAQRTGERMAAGDGSPNLAGSMWADFGIRDRKRAILLVDELLGRAGLRYAVEDAGGTARFEVKHPEWPGRVEVHGDRVTVRLGEPIGARKTVALAQTLQSRAFEGSFGPSRVSVALDVGQLLRELDPQGGGRGREAAMRALLVSFVMGFSAVDAVVLDVSPAEEGARFQGRVTLR